LEVYSHARTIQSDYSKRHLAHLYCMCEYERREPDRHDGHVVQVSATTHNVLSEVLNLRSLLFTGLLINRSKVKPWLQWLHTISFFHAAFEALAVNELRFLQLKEDKVSCPSFPHAERERLLTNVLSTELSSTFPRLRSFPPSVFAHSRSGGQTYRC
jgi:hypothetical protein